VSNASSASSGLATVSGDSVPVPARPPDSGFAGVVGDLPAL